MPSDDPRSARERRYFERPSVPIPDATFSRLVLAGVAPRVAAVNLELVKAVVRRDKRWSMRRTDVAELEYKRVLTLHLWNPRLPHPIVPTKLVDELWHGHILDTRAYHADMRRLFGRHLHHFPYLGFGSEESVRLKLEAFELSCQLYERTFGETIAESAARILPAPNRKRGYA